MYGLARPNQSSTIGRNSSKLRLGCIPFKYLASSKIFMFRWPSPDGINLVGIATEDAEETKEPEETEELQSVTSGPSVALKEVC